MNNKSKYGLDKFYTNDKVVDKILQEIDLSKYKRIIEPSAGNGSFSKKIPNCIAYDISPDDDSIIKQDFLELNLEEEKETLVIGNPPFGTNGSLALKFIKHSASFADKIAFILPKSFKKNSFYYKIPLNFWKIEEKDIEKNSFTYFNKVCDIPCVFQIYEKREELRVKPKKVIPINFEFTSKEDSNLAIRRVGIYAGKAYLNTKDKSEQSHYFIKVKEPIKFMNEVNNIQWEHNNTVGPRSISKPELIDKVDKIVC